MTRAKVLVPLLLVAGIALGRGLAWSQDSALYIDPSGRVGVGKTDPQQALDVAGVVRAQSFEGFGAVPVRAILMWSGAVNEIPPGWALCDGQNGTPDLRGRFVLAAGQGPGLTPRPIGEHAGQEQRALTVAELPAHSHGGWTATDGVHQHKIHSLSGDRAFGAALGPTSTVGTAKYQQVAGEGQFRAEEWMDTYPDNASAHRHAIAPEGQGTPFSMMPPYYALAFIMRIK
jgi:microcystin-dependent protein